MIYYTANFHQHKPLCDLMRERPVCLKAEADKCPDNDGSIYVFFWLWSFLRTSIGVGWSMDFPVSDKTFLVEPWKEMNETGELTSHPSLGTVTYGSTRLGVIVIICNCLYGGRWKFVQILVVTHLAEVWQTHSLNSWKHTFQENVWGVWYMIGQV